MDKRINTATTTRTGDASDVTGTTSGNKRGLDVAIISGGGGGPLVNYVTTLFDDDETTNNRLFVGKEKADGTWLIQLVTITDSGVDLANTFANESNNGAFTDLATAWTNRATLTYAAYSSLTGV